MKTIVNASLCLLLLNISCTQSEKKTTTNSANNIETESTIKTPEIDIQTAIFTNNLEAVKQHVKARTDLNKKDAMSGSTHLITAVSFGKKDIAKALVDGGAYLSKKNNDGATALHSAAFLCKVEMVKMLIDANADKSVLNNFGATARESVMGPFEQVKPVYEILKQQLEPMGLQMDLIYIEKTRPTIADLLQ